MTAANTPPLRVGIAGCGLIAGGPIRGRPIKGNHAHACRQVAGIQLVAASDPNPERRDGFARQWGIAAAYETTERMLAAEQLDLLVVATPPTAHEAICHAALEAHVRGILCEKPFTGTAAGARRVAGAARARGVPLVVNFSRRWDASHRALASKIQRSELGEARYLTGCYTGTLRGNGSHLLDTIRMLSPGAWQVDWAAPVAGAQSDDGPIAAELVSSTGARAVLMPIVDADYFVFELQFFLRRGRVRLTAQGNDIRVDLPAENSDYPGYRYLAEAELLPRDTLPESFALALAALAGAVRDGQPLAATPEEILGSLDLLESVVNIAKGSST